MVPDNPDHPGRIALEMLGLLRQIRDLTLEQQAAIAELPSEEAVARVHELLEERRRLMDDFDKLNEFIGQGVADRFRSMGEHNEASELESVLAETMQIDAANRLAMSNHMDTLLDQIGQLKQGKRLLDAYGKQGDPDAGFLDRDK